MFKYNFEDEFRVLKVAGTAKRGRTAWFTRTDKEIHIETEDISSQKERPFQLMQKWYHPI